MKKNGNSVFCRNSKKWDQMDEAVADALCAVGGRMEASGNLKRRIDCQLDKRPVKEEQYMKHFSVKKVVIGVAAVCLVVGTVCIAGSGLKTYISGGSAIPDYTEYEDLGKAEKEVGYEVAAIERFSNGFAMKGIHINEMAIQNEAGQQEASQKEICMDYEKGGESIRFFARRLLPVEDEAAMLQVRSTGKTRKVGETATVFSSVSNKFVPPDYELTEEDKKNMERDDFNLAYGSDEIETNVGYNVIWIKDGIIYNMYGTDLSISEDEMLDMAKEVIESGK